MENKDVEQKLQECAEEIKTPEFEKLWKEIKPRIEEEKKKKVYWRKIWRPLATGVACIAITCAIVLPIALRQPINTPNDSVLYLNDDLTTLVTSEIEFLSMVNASNMRIVDLSRFIHGKCSIFETEEKEIKGGSTEFLDNNVAPTCMISLKFYSNDVEVSDDYYSNFNAYYTTKSGANIEYKNERFDSGVGVPLCAKLLRGRFGGRVWSAIRNNPRFITAVEMMEKLSK